jgi:hypothetical protein
MRADTAEAAFAEIERLHMATSEGTLARRAARMREIACEMLGRPIPGAPPFAAPHKSKPSFVVVPNRVVLDALVEFRRSQEVNSNCELIDHLQNALAEVWPMAPRKIAVAEVIEAAEEWLRERSPVERGDLGMTTAFKDGAQWAIKNSSEEQE